MKYWRGYLTAAIIAFFSWALIEFAAAHTVLIDMVYPYVSRMLQTYLAEWSGTVDFCLWQVLLAVLVAGVLVSAVFMIILRWNPIQWFGWVLTAASVLFFLHTGIYGLNNYAGSIANDIRLEVTEYTLNELQVATIYYRDQANTLAQTVDRNANGDPDYPEFSTLASQAADGFDALVYDESYPVFAGSTVPVKQLGQKNKYAGVAGMTVALTGESAVNPDVPAVVMPFTMCHEMAHRMCIALDADADMSAFLACQANPSAAFQYSACFMAYVRCMDTLTAIGSPAALTAAEEISKGVNADFRHDLEAYTAFFGEENPEEAADIDAITAGDMLVSWHIQTIVLPTQQVDDTKFDPYDETKVDLTGIVNAPAQGE